MRIGWRLTLHLEITMTEKQLNSMERNWMIFRLMGAKAAVGAFIAFNRKFGGPPDTYVSACRAEAELAQTITSLRQWDVNTGGYKKP